MKLLLTADTLRLDTDETGWLLHATTDDGDDITLRIHGCTYAFAASEGLAELLAWHREGQRAMVERRRLADVLEAPWTP